MCWRPQISSYSYPRVAAIRINVHPVGKNLIHMTCTLPMPIHICHAYASCGQFSYVATFHANSTELDECTAPVKKCFQLHLLAWLSGPRDPPQFLSQYNLWSSALKPSICWWTDYIALLGPYLQHVISTFNTCSRGPTYRSLTNTSGGYNLGGADLPHHTPWPSQAMVFHFPPKGPAWSQVNKDQHYQLN
jgi:hypothetical protein